MHKYKFSVVACARWEEKYIREWVSYYKSLGYHHVYLYCNDDAPDSLQRECLPFIVGEDPFVTFVHFSVAGFQHEMYLHFLSNYAHETEWVSFFDIDEFLRLPAKSTINQFVESYEGVDAILFNWVVFGPCDYEKIPDGSVLENYDRSEQWLNSFTKFVCKTSKLVDKGIFAPQGFGFWHSPVGKTTQEINVVDVLGCQITNTTVPVRHRSDAIAEKIRNTAVLHHYIMKSKDYIQHRVSRGLAGAFSGQKNTWYSDDPTRQADINRIIESFNAREDRTLVNYWKDIESQSCVNMPVSFNQTLLSHNKPCMQSSISEWSKGNTVESDAANAVNREFSGGLSFHTDKEKNPWWKIDLESKKDIYNICIYNSSAIPWCAERVKNIKIDVSLDNIVFEEVFRKEDNLVIGGIASSPLVVPIYCTARYVRITLLSEDYFHLDQVEVYGES